MHKYLTDILVPAAGVHFNVFLPSEKHIGEVTQILVKLTESLCNGSYMGTTDSMLLSAETGEPYPVEATVEEVGIRSSSHLILI